MKHRLITSFALIFLVSIYSSLSPSFSETSQKKGLEDLSTKSVAHATERPHDIDGITYRSEQLIADFLSIAYSVHLPVMESLYPRQSGHGYGRLMPSFRTPLQKDVSNLAAVFPERFGEFLLRQKGRPKFAVLNKWNRDIRIGLNFVSAHSDEERKSIEQELGGHIETVAREIAGDTGLKMQFRGQVEDCAGDIDICITVSGDFSFNNPFKVFLAIEAINPMHSHGQKFYRLENYISDAVVFTPLSKAQVRGYFISDGRNNIEFAACQMWSYLDTDLMKALTTECLLRAMGLPGTARSKNLASLDAWNGFYNPHVQGLEDTLSSRELFDDLLPEGFAGEAGLQRQRQRAQAFVRRPQEVFIPYRPTAYDRKMLKILYCNKLSAGEDGHKVVETLYNTNDCL